LNRYRSGLEERIAKHLTTIGVSFEYESTRAPYIIQHFYTPDFILPNGVWLEAKGYFKSSDRTKMLAVKKDNPDLDIRLVFQAPYNKLSKKSKTTYAEWADKKGFPWCTATTLPEEWLI
jgi:hypothetical protein